MSTHALFSHDPKQATKYQRLRQMGGLVVLFFLAKGLMWLALPVLFILSR